MRKEPKAGFNLSKWALDHPALTRYLMLVLMLLGVFAFFNLGQDEDPPFTFRVMVVRAYWPGATAQQVAEQVTDKLERTLQEVPFADKIRSYSKPGEAQIIFQVKDYSKPSEVANIWYTVRKKIGDMRGLSCGAEVTSPTFSLVHEYRGGRLPVFHFDFYRMQSEAEILAMGWDDYLESDGVCVVEWASLFPALLPLHTCWLCLQPTGEGRQLRQCGAPGDR